MDAPPTPDGGVAPPRSWFEDVTLAAGIDVVRIPAEGYATLPDRMGGGVCVLDADGSPPLDVFFAMRPTSSSGSRLYVATGPLRYADETLERGLADVGDALGCLAVDLEGDGDDDLVVTGVGAVRLMENRGGMFVDASSRLSAPFVDAAMYMSASAGDADGDGDLDLAIAGYQRHVPGDITPEECAPVPCTADFRSYAPVPNLLLVRAADGSYSEGAAALAPDLAVAEPTLILSFADIDGDGEPSIYVGNDFGWSYLNRVLSRAGGATFVDVSTTVGLANDARGYGIDTMGWSMGDVDGDGSFDHVVTSFEGDTSALFMCGAGEWCEDRGDSMGMDAGVDSFRWGAALFDVDLDGDLDLLEATGHLFADEEIVSFSFRGTNAQLPNFYLNDGGSFVAVDPPAGDGLSVRRAARGLAVADLDDDGRLDVLLATASGPPSLLRNVTPRVGHHLQITLRGAGANRAALGARVTVRSGTRTFIRERIVGEGYLGTFDPRLHVGLPADVEEVEVHVTWASGETRLVTGVFVDREIEIIE